MVIPPKLTPNDIKLLLDSEPLEVETESQDTIVSFD